MVLGSNKIQKMTWTNQSEERQGVQDLSPDLASLEDSKMVSTVSEAIGPRT